jgi:WD40 repeat protein
MIKDYGPILGESLESITTTPDNKWLFAASPEGHLKQISLESQKVVHDYGLIHSRTIKCLETTRDSKWLFTGGYDGQVKRISVKNKKVNKDFGEVTHTITSMKITPDNEKLLVGNTGGNLKLISSNDGELIKDFGQVFNYGEITGIVIVADQKSFFISSMYGVLKQTFHGGLPLSISANKKKSDYGDKTLVRMREDDHGCIYSLCY